MTSDERHRERSTSKPEPMDWSTKSESSLPSPVRSRSRSGSPSPPKTITINLFPLTDSIEFAPKHLSFTPDQEIKVGRVSGSRNQKEAKQDNGVFSCDVMSREHALLKEENGKILIKDLKSTHGTFVNHVRLGDGTDESDWRTLNHGDIITFGHSVRRNQNLYKHLSAYIFYPKETGDDIHSPSASNGATSIAASPSTIKVERISEKSLLSPSENAHEATSVANTGTSQSSMLQSRSEGPASYYISKSGGLPPITSSATSPLGNKFSGLPAAKSRPTDNVTQASEALVTESKQVNTPINTNEEMLQTSIQKLKIDQPDEKSQIKVESNEPTAKSDSQDDDGDIIMENNENTKTSSTSNTSNNVENGHKLAPPEVKPDTNLVEVAEEATKTQISNRTTNVSSVSFAAPAPVKASHVTRETKQSRASRREKEIKELRELRELRESNANKSENEQMVVSNGEGPSYMTAEDSSVAISSTTSRKRKHDEIDDEGPEDINELKEKLAALQQVTKRRKWDIVYSTFIGMAAGALGLGACAYMFGA